MSKNNDITKILTILLVLMILFIIKESSQLASVVSSHIEKTDIENTEEDTLNNAPTIVIDAGHGKTAGRPKEFERKCSVLSSVSCGGSII